MISPFQVEHRSLELMRNFLSGLEGGGSGMDTKDSVLLCNPQHFIGRSLGSCVFCTIMALTSRISRMTANFYAGRGRSSMGEFDGSLMDLAQIHPKQWPDQQFGDRQW
jgi:hypothetical protein